MIESKFAAANQRPNHLIDGLIKSFVSRGKVSGNRIDFGLIGQPSHHSLDEQLGSTLIVGLTKGALMKRLWLATVLNHRFKLCPVCHEQRFGDTDLNRVW
jgi:hypothetical protein